MKITAIVLSLATAATAFCPAPTFVRPSMKMAMTAGPEEEEEGGLDLDLGEMFEMFDAVEEGTDFDEAVDKIKNDDKE